MTPINVGRSTFNRWQMHAALGTAAAALVCTATAVAGVQALGVTPSHGATSPYSACVQPLAKPVPPGGSDPLVAYSPAISSSLIPAPAAAHEPTQRTFQPTPHVAMSPK
jgi:hypothetical protein